MINIITPGHFEVKPFREGSREIHNARKKLMLAEWRKKNTREISWCANDVKYFNALASCAVKFCVRRCNFEIFLYEKCLAKLLPDEAANNICASRALVKMEF